VSWGKFPFEKRAFFKFPRGNTLQSRNPAIEKSAQEFNSINQTGSDCEGVGSAIARLTIPQNRYKYRVTLLPLPLRLLRVIGAVIGAISSAPLLLSLLFLLSLSAFAAPPETQKITLPSRKPVGVSDVDLIRVRYFPAVPQKTEALTGSLTGSLSEGLLHPVMHPAIILLPPLGGNADSPLMQEFAQYLSERGIGVALMTMPYNGERWEKGQNRDNPDPGMFYASGDPVRNARSFAQAASDVSTVADWLLTQPGVDASRLGIGGLSLGAIVVHIAMGQDERLGVGVAMLGSGDLPDLYHRGFFSLLNRFGHPSTRPKVPPDEAFRDLRAIDPLASADKNRPQNRPRRVFMVEAARDLVIPPRAATKLWNALGRPPIRWIDANHYGLLFNKKGAFDATWQYFRAAWGLGGAAQDPSFTPELSTRTIKFGFLLQEHAPNSLGSTPALTWQALSLGTRADHLPLANLDIGITGRGPYVGVSTTVTSWLDLGMASRIGRTVSTPRPYLGLHLTF
jgi:dienelactone hydrolase